MVPWADAKFPPSVARLTCGDSTVNIPIFDARPALARENTVPPEVDESATVVPESNNGPSLSVVELPPHREEVDSKLELAYALTVHKAQGSETASTFEPLSSRVTISVLWTTGPIRLGAWQLLVRRSLRGRYSGAMVRCWPELSNGRPSATARRTELAPTSPPRSWLCG